jgi:hypothetical protein
VKQDIHGHFQKLRSIDPSDNETLKPEWETNYIPIAEIEETWYENLMSPVTLTEMIDSIQKLPRNKAPGPSGITYELFQLIENTETKEYIQLLINNMLLHQITPKHMNMGTIILLPKTAAYTGDKAKLRPITLLEALKKYSRLYSTIVSQQF